MTWIKYTEKEPNKYYEPKWKQWAYWKSTWYKYWQYRPWMIKDNWKPLRKNWRKKWTILKSQVEVSKEVWQVVNLMTFWATKINSDLNKLEWVQPKTPLNITQACRELWITEQHFYYYMGKYPTVKEEYNKLKENRREYLREISEWNISKALSWKMKSLWEKDIVDYSFRMLERTDKNYNPKQVIEQTVEEINIERTTDDIINDIADLIK